MKKVMSLVLLSMLTIALIPSVSFAKDKNYTEKQLNQILIKSGMPVNVIESLDVDYKRTIVTNSGENLKYAGSQVKTFHRDDETGELIENPESSGGMFPQAAIPRSDLVFKITVFDGKYPAFKEVYGNFEWLTTGKGPSPGPYGINKDMFSIAVPDGWEIQSGKYGALMYKNWFNPVSGTYTGWVDNGTKGFENGGQPASDGYSMYGAAWRMNTSDNSNMYKGTTWLTMRRVDSDAPQRIIVQYMEAKENAIGQFGVSLAWKALSVTYTPTAGSKNEANADATFD
ncbi:hypothetical protein ACWGPW_07560 [Paenibacillus chitinolyticus]